MTIESELDRLIDAWEAKTTPPRPARSRAANAAAERHRKAVLSDSKAHPLAKLRVNFRTHGLTVAELSARTGSVSVSTIQNIEAGRPSGSPATFAALALALDCTPARLKA